jgi:hypothetical protein
MVNKAETHSELVSMKHKLEADKKQVEKYLIDLEKKLEAVNTTIGLLRGYNTLTPPTQVTTGETSIPDLKGMTQLQALTAIAKANENRFRLLDAKNALLAAGLIKTAKNANNIIFSVIQRSGKFERLSPGVYGLVSEFEL